MASMESELEVRTMNVFISRALQKVLKEAPKKHTQLRAACTSVLGTCAARCARSEHPGSSSACKSSAHKLGCCLCSATTEELKKNGAESFPLPDNSTDSPPATPQSRSDAGMPHDPVTLERAQAMVDSAKCVTAGLHCHLPSPILIPPVYP